MWRPKTTRTIVVAGVCLSYYQLLMCNDLYFGTDAVESREMVSRIIIAPLISNTMAESLKPSRLEETLRAKEPPVQEIKSKAVEPVDQPSTKVTELPKELTVQKSNDTLENYDTFEKAVELNGQERLTELALREKPANKVIDEGPVRKKGLDFVKRDNWLHEYLQRVREKVTHLKSYPREARIRRQEGDVTISFTLNKDGTISHRKVVKKCESRYINKSVAVLLSKLKFSAPPALVRDEFPKVLVVPLKYRIK